MARLYQIMLDTEFSGFYERTVRSLTAYIRHRAFSEEDAQDLVQDVYLKAWRSWQQHNVEGSGFKWLITIAHNSVIDYRRAHKPTIELEHVSAHIDSIADWHIRDDLQNVLQAISPHYREVFLLHYWYGYTYQEVSSHRNWHIQTYFHYLRMVRRQALRYRKAHHL